MRLDGLRIRNFRGIELAQLDGLASSPLITVSGPNGAGKSLFFEAIALLWRIISVWERRQIIPSNIIGAWGDAAEISVAVVLDDHERTSLAEYSARAGLPAPEGPSAEMRLLVERSDPPITVDVAPWASFPASGRPLRNR